MGRAFRDPQHDKTTSSGTGPGRHPGQPFRLAARNAAPAQTQQGGSQSDRENEPTNYEISTTRKQSSQAIGGLKHISVAVMVDGTYREAPRRRGGRAHPDLCGPFGRGNASIERDRPPGGGL